MTALDHIKTDCALPVRETAGSNRSEFIDNMFRELFGHPNVKRDPYCAVGLCYEFKHAGAVLGTHFPLTESSQEVKAWFSKRGLTSLDPDAMLAWHGALFGWTMLTGPRKGFGHVGLVATRLTADNHVVASNTYEFNTDSGGSAEGDGLYYRKRDWRQLIAKGDRKVWFCNVSDVPGGSWWE